MRLKRNQDKGRHPSAKSENFFQNKTFSGSRIASKSKSSRAQTDIIAVKMTKEEI
jgi:hypothetical protein